MEALKKCACVHGSYLSWKTWKVVEFYCDIFLDWKVLESSGNLLNSSKNYEVNGR